jgi:hypothetical protein
MEFRYSEHYIVDSRPQWSFWDDIKGWYDPSEGVQKPEDIPDPDFVVRVVKKYNGPYSPDFAAHILMKGHKSWAKLKNRPQQYEQQYECKDFYPVFEWARNRLK